MELTGTVISASVNKQLKTKTGSLYDGWELVYKDLATDEIKTISKPSQTLTQVMGLKDSLSALAAGDKFVCTMEKDGNYWKITGLSKGELATPLQTPQKKAWGGQRETRDFETKEERAIRQHLITRQSSMSSAIEFATSIKGKTEEDIFTLAEKIDNWVWEGGK